MKPRSRRSTTGLAPLAFRWPWLLRLGLTLGATLAAGTVAAQVEEAVYSLEEVKAAFLYHFSSYVEWPAGQDTGELTIAVIGDDPVADALALFLRGRTIQGRQPRLRRLNNFDNLDGVQVLYIGPAENWRLDAWLEHVRERPVLVVTDEMNLHPGAMVNFQMLDRRLRFEVSLPAAEAVGLNLSSRLLSAAARVETIGWLMSGIRNAQRQVAAPLGGPWRRYAVAPATSSGSTG
jgi:hypothetical protein